MLLSDFHVPATIAGLALLAATVAVPAIAAESGQGTINGQRCLVQTILVPANVAVISNTGSTNTVCYRIYVSQSGQATYVDGDRQGNGIISAALASKFFSDISAAQPLSQLPEKHCLKSVSFGTSTFVRLGGEESPDLSCPGNAKAEALFNDAEAITQALKVTNYPLRGEESSPVTPPLNQ